jgi:hypothetical protein
MNFVVNNQERFQTNSAIHSVNTRNMDHLHRQTVNLSCFQKNAYYAGVKIFNNLPSNLRSAMNKKAQFKVALKRYLNTHSFYPVEEFLTFKMTHNVWKRFFFSYCLLYGLCIIICIYSVSKFLCYLHSILKKYLSVVSSFCFVVAAFICKFSIFMTYATSYCCHLPL